MSKQLPNTREEAFAYQFEDDVKILHSMAVMSKEGFRKSWLRLLRIKLI
jgi:hypothetical protein